MFMTSKFSCVGYDATMMLMVLVNSSLRTGSLSPRGPEEQGTYNGDISIRMRMLRIMGHNPDLDASLQWVEGLWWWWYRDY